MKNANAPQEKISALADGELEPSEIDAVLASLRRPEERKEWDIYHQIGDVLRSDEMAVELSPGFAARMAAKLDAEPTILAPTASAPPSSRAVACAKTEAAKRYFVPGVAAALAIFTAYLVAPQFKDGDATSPQNFTAPSLASVGSQTIASAPASAQTILPVAVSTKADVSGEVQPREPVVLRDPSIDEYLAAHQRYSPSLYDTTQFVRSATFDAEPNK